MSSPDDHLPEAPRPDAIPDLRETDETGVVVWHREHLRTTDNPALARAVETADRVCPLFVIDPTFYGEGSLACDARIQFLHECLSDLDDQYRDRTDGSLTLGHGDPLDVLDRFHTRGWDVFAVDAPTGRYGHRRDRAARDRFDAVFLGGDGLVRGTDDPRDGWQETVESFLTADPFEWTAGDAAVTDLITPITTDRVAEAYGIDPEKTVERTGGTTAAWERLEAFVARIGSYPGSISSPVDAREGTSGLSPYLKYGCLSVREAYQYVQREAPDCRGTELFVSRLFWNLHYRQKVLDWPGWLDTAVNPVLAGFNADSHDSELVERWKEGRTGYPMVDASMRCLRETGWLNFRMRAMCVSFYYHVLHQPWQIGADYFHEQLFDSVAAINYTQWQYQCGLVGKPGLRLYNPRKQVRDQDPDGEFITRWVPELADLPTEFLDRPEHTPRSVQEECGVILGETYPYPVREYEAAKEAFWRQYNAVREEAAARLADPEIARRASLSGGLDAAKRIASDVADDASRDRQSSLSAFSS
ncbi:MAG: FAD-binding domain-containing protein [Halobaculum sp.]